MALIAEIDISDNSWILLGVAALLVIVVAYSMLTRKGTGIDKHRTQDQKRPGAEGPAEEAAVDQGEGSPTENTSGMR